MDGDFFADRRTSRHSHMHVVREIQERDADLTSWERAFLISLARFPTLSQKQASILAEILVKTSEPAKPRAKKRAKRDRRGRARQ
jgi:hypothetical protein